MFVISDRVTVEGAISLTDIDQALLQTVPPTERSRERAKELGSYLGELLHANHAGHSGRDEITGEILTQAGSIPLSVQHVFYIHTMLGYERAYRTSADNASSLRSKEGITA